MFQRTAYGQFLILYFMTLTAACAQGFTAIRGVVSDAETGEVLPEVIISIQYSGFSAGANEEGHFLFKYPNILTDSAVVTASAIGYMSKQIPTKDLDHSKLHMIQLEPAEPIQVMLGVSNARGLVQSALDSMKRSHFEKPMLQNGFYLETAEIINTGVVKIKEAVLRVERFPGEEILPDRMKALKNRQLNLKGHSEKVEAWQFINGPAIAARAIETERPDFLQPDALKKYDFVVDSLLIPFDSLKLYVVQFQPRSANLRGGRTGKIYIDTDSKSVIRIEYELTPKALKEVIGPGLSNVKLTGKSLKYSSQYRKSEGKWLLHENRATVDLTYEEKLDRKFKSDAHWEYRFVANESRDLRRGGVTEAEQLIHTRDFKKATSLGAEYWDSYGYLLPSQRLIEMQRRLR
ncbi:hypothetical protein [Jiulongibacter sediminis]|uniref:hypothetical protein n=1 Tax=Jiulongibacter sediminis TaxID=1605367 RepID=UPI0026F243AA|nr:hypothetical protein [Jiulongibacter sediminis]